MHCAWHYFTRKQCKTQKVYGVSSAFNPKVKKSQKKRKRKEKKIGSEASLVPQNPTTLAYSLSLSLSVVMATTSATTFSSSFSRRNLFSSSSISGLSNTKDLSRTASFASWPLRYRAAAGWAVCKASGDSAAAATAVTVASPSQTRDPY